jgi:orotidine-5'-phosphate decarboxylase
MPNPFQANERLIVALDLPSAEEARAMVDKLDGVVQFFKIGLALQLAPGVGELIRSLILAGKKVFLDYKYYDIPETDDPRSRQLDSRRRGGPREQQLEVIHRDCADQPGCGRHG